MGKIGNVLYKLGRFAAHATSGLILVSLSVWCLIFTILAEISEALGESLIRFHRRYTGVTISTPIMGRDTDSVSYVVVEIDGASVSVDCVFTDPEAAESYCTYWNKVASDIQVGIRYEINAAVSYDYFDPDKGEKCE